MRSWENLLRIFIFTFAVASSIPLISATAQNKSGEGTLFVVEIVTRQTNEKDMVERTISILEARLKGLDAKGEVSRSKEGEGRILVKVFGTHDAERLRGLFRNHQLDVRAVVSPPSPSPFKGYSSFEEAQKVVEGLQEVRTYEERAGEILKFVILEGNSIINGTNVRKAEAFSRTDREDDYQISFWLDEEGAVNLSRWTERNINRYLAVMLDGKIVSVSYVKSVISDEGEISGRFSKSEARELASNLQSGALPVTLRIVTETKFKKSN